MGGLDTAGVSRIEFPSNKAQGTRGFRTGIVVTCRRKTHGFFATQQGCTRHQFFSIPDKDHNTIWNNIFELRSTHSYTFGKIEYCFSSGDFRNTEMSEENIRKEYLDVAYLH